MEIGPQLPPDLACKLSQADDDIESDNKIDNSDKNEARKNRNSDDESFGPVLPPGFQSRPTAIIGPCRPETGITGETGSGRKTPCEDDKNGEDDESCGTIGPMLPTQDDKDQYLIRRREEIESRAKVKKDDLASTKDGGLKKLEREEWMTELPPELSKNFGLGPRKFRNREVDLGDRSVWTDTPLDKAKKQSKQVSNTPERREKSKKELDTEQYVAEHNKRHRAESLLDVHQREKKKAKKNEGSSVKERVPFDRETDLGLRQMDAAKRRSLIKQSKHLNTKFEHSKQGPTYL